MADEKKPEMVREPVTGRPGTEAPERLKGVPYQAHKGWVKDPGGRFHEVDDVDRFLEAYPGSEKVKPGDVIKSKVGYEDAAAVAVVAEQPSGGTQSEG